MSTKTRVLTWGNVDVDNDAEMREFLRQEEERARERAADAVRHLHEQGIIDAQGRRVRKDVPEDMREGSECDLG